MFKHKPAPDTYPAYFETYTKLVDDVPVLEALRNHLEQNSLFWEGISEQHSLKSYAPGKWSIKELFLHVIDTERIFAYRALAFARGEKAALPGFDHDEYVKQSRANQRPWLQLLAEYKTARQNTLSLFASFDQQQLEKRGTASGKEASVLSLGYIIAGHDSHHRKVTEEKYLPF